MACPHQSSNSFEIFVFSAHAPASLPDFRHVSNRACASVLLVMLHGSKRFRVAGRSVGSAVAIDHVMRPGDAIYIPSLTFHSGGSGEALAPEDSMLLSVALEWPEPEGRPSAAVVVDQWKVVRQSLMQRLPNEGYKSDWAWAGTTDGTNAMRKATAGSSVGKLLERFLGSSDADGLDANDATGS